MHRHELTLIDSPSPAGSTGDLRIRADLLRDVLSLLLEGAQQAARYYVQGASTKKGPRPAWLEAVSRVEITGLRAGSTVVDIEAPTLREAAAHELELSPMASFGESDPGSLDHTAIDLFGAVLGAVTEDENREIPADRKLLETCAEFARLAARATGGIRLAGLAGRHRSMTIAAEHVERFESVRDSTPEPQAIRLTGILDTISASRADIVLRLSDGTKVSGRLVAHDGALLQGLFDTQVVVSGLARYRPSGRLALIDVEHIAAAEPADALFGQLPPPPVRRPVAEFLSQDEYSGVAAFYNTWPGDETDEELQRALKELD